RPGNAHRGAVVAPIASVSLKLAGLRHIERERVGNDDDASQVAATEGAVDAGIGRIGEGLALAGREAGGEQREMPAARGAAGQLERKGHRRRAPFPEPLADSAKPAVKSVPPGGPIAGGQASLATLGRGSPVALRHRLSAALL